MLNWISDALGAMQQDKALLAVTLVLVYGIGTVFTMIGGEVRESWRERRYRKWEADAEYEAERIRHGWDEENSDEWSLTNETYHAAAPRQQRTLSQQWRERVAQAAQPVMETYVPQQNWSQYNQTTVQWPQWSEQDRAIVGRHRLDETLTIDAMPVSPGQGYTPRQLRALVGDTGAFSAIDLRELVGVGSS